MRFCPSFKVTQWEEAELGLQPRGPGHRVRSLDLEHTFTTPVLPTILKQTMFLSPF